MRSDFNLPANPGWPNEFFLFFLNQIPGLGDKNIWRLIQGEINTKVATTIAAHLKNKVFVRQTKIAFANIQEPYLTILDPDYPQWLATIYDPPLWLYYRGRKQLLQRPHLLTVVGSRTLTHYHQEAIKRLIKDLSSTDLIIISGLARGIDSIGHQAALTNNLDTIAVLGSGLDDAVLYPKENIVLAHQIIKQGGLLLSEYPAKTKSQLHHFPRRNRILAGLSQATLVISGAKKSGTLITAQVAVDENREVLALPGNINYSLNQGPNTLLSQGAKIVNSATDILKIYHIESQPQDNTKIKFKNQQHAQIYTILQTEPLTLVELAKRLSQSISQMNILVSELEIQGLIKFNQFNQIEII